jgi:hypothetical protein
MLDSSRQQVQVQVTAIEKKNQQLTALSQIQQQKLDSTTNNSTTQAEQSSLERDILPQEQAQLSSELSQREQELADTRHQMLLSKAALQMERFRLNKMVDTANKEHQTKIQHQETQLADLSQHLETHYQRVKEQRQTIDQLKQQRSCDAAELLTSDNLQVRKPKDNLEPPRIEIIEPPVVLVRSMPTVKLIGNDTMREIVGRITAPNGIFSLTINDKTTIFEDNNLFRASIAIDVKPKPVEVVVVDKRGQRSKLAFTFIGPPTDSRAQANRPPNARPEKTGKKGNFNMGNYHALIIGNNNYLHVSTLASAVNDAKTPVRTLREKYHFKTKLLLNADRHTILSQLNELREQLISDDNLLIYYAGHGILDETNERGYWLPVDVDATNNANWISNTAIIDILNVIEAKHILVIADSCFSGTLTQTPLPRTQANIPAAVRTEWIKVMSETRARITLTSGGVEPVLDGRGGGHSIFAKAFLETLRANDGIPEGYALHYQILGRLTAGSMPSGHTPVPRYAPIHLAGHEPGEFFFNSLESI